MWDDLRLRFRSLFRRNAVESEMDEELRFHMDRQFEKYLRSGMNRDDAMRRVRLEFGGWEQVREECRESRGVSLVETVGRTFDMAGACYASLLASWRRRYSRWHWGLGRTPPSFPSCTASC
ncbi:MAG: permease prefix domain 1-containing protein [Paludibaculum sp.]